MRTKFMLHMLKSLKHSNNYGLSPFFRKMFIRSFHFWVATLAVVLVI